MIQLGNTDGDTGSKHESAIKTIRSFLYSTDMLHGIDDHSLVLSVYIYIYIYLFLSMSVIAHTP